MNREIKFKAWTIDTGFPNKPIGKIWTQDELFGSGFSYQNPFSRGDMTLLQFTGLKDKNGKEIYEGDICNTPDGVHSVNWGVDSWQFAEAIRKSPEYEHFDLCHWGISEIEVIGNIYENKELLKQKH